jgi:hypothetical protein
MRGKEKKDFNQRPRGEDPEDKVMWNQGREWPDTTASLQRGPSVSADFHPQN